MADTQSNQAAPEQQWRAEWKRLEQSDVYNNANDMERQAMRVGVFRDYVAPKLRNTDLKKGFEIFNAQTAPMGDPNSGLVGDAVKLFKVGVQQGAADIFQGMTLGHKNAASDTLRDWAQENTESLSPTTLRDIQNFGIERDEDSWTGLDFKEGSTWRGFLGSTVQGFGSMVPSMVPGGLLGKGFGIAGKAAAGTNKAFKAATKANKFIDADKALALGTKIEKRAMSIGQSTGMGTMIMGGTSNQAYEDAFNQPESELVKSAEYRQYLSESNAKYGNDAPELAKQEARQRWAEEASLKNRLESFGIGAVSGLSQAAQLKLFKGAGSKTRLGGMGKSGLLEAGQETWESGGQQFLTNKSIAESGLERDLWKGVPGAAATGALLGFAVGAPMGGFAKPQQALTPEQEQQRREDLEGNLKTYKETGDQIEAQLQKPGLDDEQIQTFEAELEENYRNRYDVERMINGLPPVPRTHDPVNADPNREIVPPSIDEDIKESRKDKTDTEQSLKREMKNGGDEDTAQRYEKEIGKRSYSLGIEQAMADNRGYSKYFNTKEEFADWLIRSRKGGFSEFSAKAELGQRVREYNDSLSSKEKEAQTQWANMGMASPNTRQPISQAAVEMVAAAEKETQAEAEQVQQQQQSQAKQQTGADRIAKQKQIDEQHFKTSKIGRYQVYPVGKDQFMVSGLNPAESGSMNKLGGHYDKNAGGWVFPKNSRPEVESQLSQLAKKPQPKQKTKVAKYPKTARKQERRKLAEELREARAELERLNAERKEENQFKRELLGERARPAALKALEKRQTQLNNKIKTLTRKINELAGSEEEAGQANRSLAEEAIAKRKAAKLKAREEREEQRKKDQAEASKAEQQSVSEKALHQRRLDKRHHQPVSIGPYTIWTDNPDSFYVSGATEAESASMRSLKGVYNKDKSSWEFPKNRRFEVEHQLENLSRKPQKQRKKKKQRVYQKTIQKRSRRLAAKGATSSPGLGMMSVAEKEQSIAKQKAESQQAPVEQGSVSVVEEKPIEPKTERKKEPEYPTIQELESDGSLSGKDADRSAKIMSVIKKKKGESVADRGVRIRKNYQFYKELQTENMDSLQSDHSKDDLVKMAKEIGAYKSIYSKGQLAAGLLEWRDKVSKRIKIYKQWTNLKDQLKALVKNKMAIPLESAIKLNGKHGWIYTDGDQDVAAIVGDEYLNPKGQRGDNESLYLLAEDLLDGDKEAEFSRLLNDNPDVLAMAQEVKSIRGSAGAEIIGSLVDLTPAAKAIGVPDQYAKEFGERFDGELSNLIADLYIEPEKVTTTAEPVQETAESIHEGTTTTVAVPGSDIKKVPAEALSDSDLVDGIADRIWNTFPADFRQQSKKGDFKSGAERLAKAIKDKNVDYLISLLDQGSGNNTGSKKAFQWATGQEGIGMTAKANRQAVYDWAGWTPEQIEGRRKGKEQKLAKKIGDRKREAAITAAENVPINVDGKPGTLKEWVDRLIADGATELKKTGDKIPKYWLINPDTQRGADLSKLSKKGYKGVAKVARDYAEVALEDFNNKPAKPESNNDQIREPVTPTVAEPEPIKTEKPVKQETAPTARQKRNRKRTGKIIEFDHELMDSSKELTEAFRKQAGKLTSGVDPVFIAEVLRLGTKTGVLLIKKGAVKFADWADNMLAVFEAQDVEPEQVAPYLKELYGSVSNSSQLSDAEADQMDDSRTVRRFDMDNLLGDEYTVTRTDVTDDVMQQAEQAGRGALEGNKREDWYDSTQIAAQVKVAINNSLFTNVPEQFAHDNLEGLVDEVFEQVKTPVSTPTEESATIPPETTTEATTNERTDNNQERPAGSEPTEISGTGAVGATGANVSGVPGTTESGGSASSGTGKTGSSRPNGRSENSPVDATGSQLGEGDNAGPDNRGDTSPVRSEDYRITDGSLAEGRSWPEKASDNIAAIKILKQLKTENRNARPDEQAILVRYVGWGASDLANNMFPVKGRQLTENWQALHDELKDLLTDKEWKAAASTVNSAFFTNPSIINTMYAAAKRFGIKSGLTLEGGTGIGNFAGLIPTDMNLQYTGVEMDPTSAMIAQALYPGKGIINGDFTKVGFPDNHFNLVIGNPPYVNSAVKSDPKYAGKNFQLHDYFIAKQIDSLKPGGIGVFVTSSKTLDKQGQEMRQYVNDKAHFLGAIRLPNTAFSKNAGTEVVTDIIFFQKRGEKTKETDHSWISLGDHPTLLSDTENENGVYLPEQTNRYFLDNPDRVLGTEAMVSGPFGKTYTVKPALTRKKGESKADWENRLDTALTKAMNKSLKQLPSKIVKENPTPEAMTAEAAKFDFKPEDKEDSFYIREDGSIGLVINGYGQSAQVMGGGSRSGLNKKQQQYIRSYIPLRKTVMDVYKAQYGTDEEWQAAVKAMDQEYDAFVKKNGPINQGSVSIINYKKGPKAGTTSEQVREPIISTLQMDPEAFRIAAIESYDMATNTAKKTRIFTERVLGVQPTPNITSAVDAVGATLNQFGYLDMEKVQELYNGLPINEIISELGDQIYSDPATGKYVLKDNYLSGNVKAKLQQAKNKAATDPAYQRNVTALEAVIPEDLPVSAIPMNLGGMWIPTDTIAKFAKEVMEMSGVDVSKSQVKEKSSWKFSGKAEASPYATERRSAADIMEATLNQRAIIVKDTVMEDGKKTYVTNDKETAAAVQKQTELKEAFDRWTANDGETADLLSKIYNRDFNTTVPTVHNGQHLTFPGLSGKYQLRPHQKDVAWRIIQNGNTYMAHAVGAGKTLASIVSAMELKRLGLVNKPTFVVLKSTLNQFSAEFLDAYPGARLLVANEKQLDAKNRRRFMAKIANENWDAVIMTHNSFQSIPMSDAYTEQYINQQIQDLEDVLDDLSEDEMPTRKTIEAQKKKLVEKLEKHIGKAAANSDKGLSYEESGIDFLFIDEAHTHKKVGFPTRQANLKGVDSASSGIASDLFMKTQFMEGRNPGKHTVLMSGTPITNTMGELFNIQRYLQPSVMEANQISSFDAWSATFAESTTNIEMQSDGSFKPTTRLTRFVGVPGLMRDVLQVMDYVGMEQMREQGLVKLPAVNRQVMASEKTPAMALFQKELGARIAAFEKMTPKEKKEKGVDGILAIMTDGRKAAIDLRLVGRTQVGPSKLDNTISTVFDTWQNTRSTVYTDKDGQPDPVTGSIQLIFSDIAKSYDSVTSKNEEGKEVTTRTLIFDAFKYIKQQLVSRGIPASEIAFITDYADSMKKKRLFNEVNSGKKTIVIGGSDNLGTGVNVQKRLISLHNLDINYVPAKMSQRTGRGERQGNQNTEINNYLYVTKGTTDATVLQLNENKTRMADQVLRGDFSVTSMEDVGASAADDLAQAKAIASGNPLLMEQASVSGEYRRLVALRDAHTNKMATYRRNVMADTNTLESYERSLPEAQAMAGQYVDTRGDQFTATINGQTLSKRKEAGDALMAQMDAALTSKSPNPEKIGKVAGYDLYVFYDKNSNEAVMTFKPGNPDYTVAYYQSGDELSSAGLISRVENRAAGIKSKPANIQEAIDNINDSITRWRKGLNQKFEQAQELKDQKARLDEIEAELESGGQADNEVLTLPHTLDSPDLSDFIQENGNTNANIGQEGEYGTYQPEGSESPELVYQLKDGRLVALSDNKVIEISPDQVTQTAPPETRYSLVAEGQKPVGIKPYEAKVLQNQLTRAIGDLATVVQNESQLPKHLYDQIKADGVQSRVKGVYDPQTDSVYVIASNADSLSDGMRTALHEAVGHKGLRGVLGSSLNKTLDQIYDSLPDSMIRRLRKEYINQLAGKSQEEQRRIVTEEYLAHLAETDPQNNLVQRVIAKIRNWMRQYLPSLKWSDGDIRQLMIEAGQKAKDDRQNMANRSDSPRYMVDRTGKFVLNNEGNIDFGEVTSELSKEIRRQAGKIRLEVGDGSYGMEHIIERHTKELNKTGNIEQDIINFVENIIRNPDFIQSAQGGQLAIVKKMSNAEIIFIDLMKNKGEFWTIRSAHMRRIKSLPKGDVLWERIEPAQPSPVESSTLPDRPENAGKSPANDERGHKVESSLSETSDTDKKDNPDSSRYKLSAFSTQDSAQAKQAIGRTASSLMESIRSKSLGWLGGRQISDLYGKLFDAVKGKNPLQLVSDLTQKLSATRSVWANAADRIDNMWARLAANKHSYKQVNDLMYESTIAEVDPSKEYEPKHDTYDLNNQYQSAVRVGDGKVAAEIEAKLKEEEQRKADHDRLSKLYEPLPDNAKEVFTEVRDFYQEQWNATREALHERVKGMGLDAGATSGVKAQIDALFHRSISQGPYFPLMRFGEFAAIGETPEGKPFRQHFESQKAMKDGIEALTKSGHKIESSGKTVQLEPSQMSGVTNMTSKIMESLDTGKMGKNLNDSTKAAFMDEINQMALAMLPELSAAKRSMHRNKVAGYDTNARRSFATVALHGANRLGRIKYGWQIEQQLDRMDEVTDASKFSPLDEDEKIAGRSVAIEMRKRHDLNMNPNGHPIASHITNAAFIMYLGGSIGAGLVNMTQNILVALPQLGSRYGYAKTSRAMARASKDYFAFGGKKPEGMDGLLRDSWFDLTNAKPNKHITADEIALIQTLIDDGTIDTTQAHTLAQIADSDIRPEAQKTKDWYTKMTRASGLFFHNAEVSNRQIAALTAYRLYKENAKGSFDPQKGTDFARKAVFDAHFDYSGYNRPRNFKGNWSKVLLIFKQHSQNMTYNLTKTFYDGVVDKNTRGTEEGAIARRTLLGTLGLHATFAGVMGLPGMSVMLYAAGLAMGDEDDPVDPEVELRNIFADWFGVTNGHALSKGVFNGYFGMDLHSRTSLNDLWIKSPGYDMPARQEAMYYVTNAIGGPAVSQAVNSWVGLDEMMTTGSMKGLQRMMPKFIRDGLKTIEYSDQGVLDRNGKVINDDMTPGQLAWQAVGIGSAKTSESYAARGAVLDPKGKITKRQTLLLDQRDRAVRNNDQQLLQQTDASIDRFNEVQRERGRDWAVITPQRKRRSLATKQKARDTSKTGVVLPDSQLGMRENARSFAI